MTPAQLTLFKSDIIARFGANPLESTVATYYNAVGNADAWNSHTPVDAVFNAITWTNFTPVDVPDTTALFTNRLMVINVKQMNLQNILVGRDFIDASKVNVRAGLRDCVIALPAGALGAAVSAGGASGATVLTACLRKCNALELLLTTGTQVTGTVTAHVLGFEGTTNPQQISDLLGGLLGV